MTTTNAFECWTTGYLPTGRKVSFTLSAETPAALIALALDFDRQLISAGIQTNEPGLDEGEQAESVGVMVKRMKDNQDGTQTPVIDIYLENEALQWAFMKVYLNTAEDIEAFTLATGLMLGDMPEYESSAALERGKSPNLDAKYMRKPKRPARFVWQHNPRYEEGAMKPKKLFVRWLAADATPDDSSPTTVAATKPAAPTKRQNPYGGAVKPTVSHIVAVETRQKRDGKGVFYQMALQDGKTAFAFTRKVLEPWAFEEDTTDWNEVGFAMEFETPIPVYVKLTPREDGDPYLNIERALTFEEAASAA